MNGNLSSVAFAGILEEYRFYIREDRAIEGVRSTVINHTVHTEKGLVVEDGRIVGIVSRSDIVRMMARDVESAG